MGRSKLVVVNAIENVDTYDLKTYGLNYVPPKLIG